MTSPLALVPKAHQIFIAILLLMNLALPSAIAVLAPPGWLLQALVYWPKSAPQPTQPNRQADHLY